MSKQKALPVKFPPPPNEETNMAKRRNPRQELNEQKKQEIIASYRKTLNPDQQKAYDLIMAGQNTFISGGGGVGKSFLIRTVCNAMHGIGKNVLVCAPTGVAASLIGGATTNKCFGWSNKLPLNTKGDDFKSSCVSLVYLSDLILVDEISMVSCIQCDSIFETIQKCNKKRAELGKDECRICFVGDLLQLPPVITGWDRPIIQGIYDKKGWGDIGDGYCFKALHWKDFNLEYCKLDIGMRQSLELDRNMLNAIRDGYVTQAIVDKLNSMVSPVEFKDAPYLMSKIEDVDGYNMEKLKELPGEMHYFKPIYKGQIVKELAKLEQESGKKARLNKEKSFGVYQAAYKVGARVMFTTNSFRGAKFFDSSLDDMYWDDLFVNGTVGIIRDIQYEENHDDVDITVEFEDSHGETKLVHVFQMEHDISIPMSVDGRWFVKPMGTWSMPPLKVCYATSIHKAQGQSLAFCNINPDNLFSPAQFYVAASRATAISHIYLTRPITVEDIKINTEVIEFYNQMEGRDKGYRADYSWLLESEDFKNTTQSNDIPENLKFDGYGRVREDKDDDNIIDDDSELGKWLDEVFNF